MYKIAKLDLLRHRIENKHAFVRYTGMKNTKLDRKNKDYEINTQYFAVDDNNDVVGSIKFSLYTGETESFVWDLFVYREHRGKGIATALIKEVIKDHNKKYDMALTAVADDAKLNGFYDKLGFEQTETTVEPNYDITVNIRVLPRDVGGVE